MFNCIAVNGLWLGDAAAKRTDFYRQDRKLREKNAAARRWFSSDRLASVTSSLER